jgi:hypothetical protein
MDYRLRNLGDVVMGEVSAGGAIDLAILDCLEKAYALGFDEGTDTGREEAREETRGLCCEGCTEDHE